MKKLVLLVFVALTVSLTTTAHTHPPHQVVEATPTGDRVVRPFPGPLPCPFPPYPVLRYDGRIFPPVCLD